MSVVSTSRLPGWRLSTLICLLALFCFWSFNSSSNRAAPRQFQSSSAIRETPCPAQNPEKAGINGVWLNLILDESGSMDPVRMPTIETINKYIAEQKQTCASVAAETASPMKCHVSLTKFSDPAVKPVFDRVSIQDTPALSKQTYSPNGGTNLLDAIGSVIKKVDAHLSQSSADISARPAVLVVIMTDGEENSSRHFNTSQIRDMITARQTMGWTFVFLGANIDAWATAQSYGVNRENAFNYDVGNQEPIVMSLSGASSRYIHRKSVEEQAYQSAPSAEKLAHSLFGGIRDSFFSQEERDKYEY